MSIMVIGKRFPMIGIGFDYLLIKELERLELVCLMPFIKITRRSMWIAVF